MTSRRSRLRRYTPEKLVGRSHRVARQVSWGVAAQARAPAGYLPITFRIANSTFNNSQCRFDGHGFLACPSPSSQPINRCSGRCRPLARLAYASALLFLVACCTAVAVAWMHGFCGWCAQVDAAVDLLRGSVGGSAAPRPPRARLQGGQAVHVIRVRPCVPLPRCSCVSRVARARTDRAHVWRRARFCVGQFGR